MYVSKRTQVKWVEKKRTLTTASLHINQTRRCNLLICEKVLKLDHAISYAGCMQAQYVQQHGRKNRARATLNKRLMKPIPCNFIKSWLPVRVSFCAKLPIERHTSRASGFEQTICIRSNVPVGRWFALELFFFAFSWSWLGMHWMKLVLLYQREKLLRKRRNAAVVLMFILFVMSCRTLSWKRYGTIG